MWDMVGFVVSLGGFIGIPVWAQIRWQEKCSRLSLEDRADRGYRQGFDAGFASGVIGLLGMGILAALGH